MKNARFVHYLVCMAALLSFRSWACDGEGGSQPKPYGISCFSVGEATYKGNDRICASFVVGGDWARIYAGTENAPCASEWTLTVPGSWGYSLYDVGWDFNHFGSVLPTHADLDQPAVEEHYRPSWTVKIECECVNAEPESDSESASQDSTDHILQCYIDHGITVPAYDDFDGATMPLKVTTQVNQLRACFQNEYPGANLPIYCGYRNPEKNESLLPKSSPTSYHQYAIAVDLSPIPDMDGDGSKEDEAAWLVEHAESSCPNHTEAGHAEIVKTSVVGNSVHVDWGPKR